MIIVTTSYNGKEYKHQYKGTIFIKMNNVFLNINWYYDEKDPPSDEEWIVWNSHGWDLYYLEDVVSIEGVDS